MYIVLSGKGFCLFYICNNKIENYLIYHGELNDFKPHEHAISNKDFCLFVLFMVSWSSLYSGNYQGYAMWLPIEEFSFIMFLFSHVEAFKLLKLVRMLSVFLQMYQLTTQFGTASHV